MYDEATARKMLQEVRLPHCNGEVIIDRELVVFQGFNPDALDSTYFVVSWGEEITPMLRFAETGDAKMCRYLISRGASTTKAVDGDQVFPMLSAATQGHLDVCKVLYANGAHNDVRKTSNYNEHLPENWTPFFAASYNEHVEVVRWLVLHGALCADNESEVIEGERIDFLHRSPNKSLGRSRDALVAWAEEVTQSHSAFITFLGGTLPPAPDEDHRCMLQCLSGHPGVRKHIGDYFGLEITKRKHLRILRSVVEVLPSYIER